jgi:hypothetical protein
MKNLFLIFLILFSVNIFGQIHSIGIQSGLNFSNQKGSLFSDSKYEPGIIEAICYEYKFSNNYTLGMDMAYCQKRFLYNVVRDGTLNGIKLDYNYLSLPVKFGYSIGRKFIGSVKLGISPSILISSNSSLSLFDKNGKLIVDLKNDATKFELGGSLDVGASYVFKNQFELYSSLSYNQGITAFINSKSSKDGKLWLYGFSMVMGLKYRLITN